jgi:hypothetical protein
LRVDNLYSVQVKFRKHPNLYSSFKLLKVSTFCPHIAFTCSAWFSEQAAIMSPLSPKWLVIITETESVYWAVRTLK